MNKWLHRQYAISGRVGQEYRKAILQEDVNQARTVIAIVAVWVLGYIYADYLDLGSIQEFYYLIVLRVIFFSASGMIFFIFARAKNVNFVDITVFMWSIALVILALLSNASREISSLENIMIHYILIIGFYLLIPNRLLFKFIPSFIVTVVDIYILITCMILGVTDFTGSTIFTSISTLVAINALGILSTTRLEYRRFKQYLVQKTLRDGRAQLKQLAITDSLTGILNRRGFLEAAQIEFDRSKRYKEPFAFAIIDLDKLKTVNDTFGHPAGDLALQRLVEIIKQEKRSSDTIGRLAGDEFGLLLPNTHSDQTLEFMSRIKNILTSSALKLPNEKQAQVSISAGVTEVKESDTTFDDIYRRADKALLIAKDHGRNKIEKA